MNAVLDKIDTLPPELRAVVESDEIILVIDEICENFDIPYSWRSELIRATVHVLTGIMSPVQFIPFIISEYSLEREDALQIAIRINERIFSAVKPQLASLHNIEDDKLAHRIKVPHKPRKEEELEQDPYNFISYENEEELEQEKIISKESVYIPSTSSIPPAPLPRVVADIKENAAGAPKSDEDKLVKSALSEKLGGMKVDQYREKF